VAGLLGLFALFISVNVSPTNGEDVVTETEEFEGRDGKVLPIFQVVRFPNDICSGTSRNGTCYTAEECSTKGGTGDASCASGFGVCCIFSLSCGGSASENSSYIIQSSATTLTSPCTYTICPCSNGICRIRYDFTTFVLASAVAGTSDIDAQAAAATQRGGSIGDCMTDQFSITNPGSAGSPVICGPNGGYHMILDASESCQIVNFNIGGSTSTTRKWDIKVTQYACGDYDMSGWPGCLQYYTGTSNTIQNFAFPTSSTTVTTGVTHLSNQVYDICIRRAATYCYICYSPLTAAGATAAAQATFGVSISIATASQAATGTSCSNDYLEIPYGNSATIAAITTPSTAATNFHRQCGRFFNTASAATSSNTVCSRNSPFRVGVSFDTNEVTGTAIADAKASTSETSEVPGGIVGFKLIYFQVAC